MPDVERCALADLLNRNILGQRFEALAIGLYDRNCDLASLTGIDISHHATFALVRPANYFAPCSVF